MAKKKVTETTNKDADVKAFVEENYGKTLSSEDIDKSKISLKETTKKHYENNPELAKARKKQVSDYKNYKASKTNKKKETGIEEPINDLAEKDVNDETETKDDVTIIEHKPVESVETVVSIEKKEEKPKPKSALEAYGHCHMGICYD